MSRVVRGQDLVDEHVLQVFDKGHALHDICLREHQRNILLGDLVFDCMEFLIVINEFQYLLHDLVIAKALWVESSWEWLRNFKSFDLCLSICGSCLCTCLLLFPLLLKQF